MGAPLQADEVDTDDSSDDDEADQRPGALNEFTGLPRTGGTFKT